MVDLRLARMRLSWTMSSTCCGSVGENVLDLVVAEQDLVDRLSAVLEGNVVAVHVGWQEDLGVPHESLAGREVRDLL